MSPTAVVGSASTDLPSGPGAAAILAAGIGALALALFAIATDRVAGLPKLMTFSKPTGPLSGVTTCSVVMWLVVWVVLDLRWGKRAVALGPIVTVALGLLFLSLLLTFPPIADLF